MERANNMNKAIELMRSHGAIIIDPVNITNIDDNKSFVHLWSLLLINFREDIASYLSELRNTTIQSLDDLIQFNSNHSDEEFHPQFAPNQRIFEMSNNYTKLSSVNHSRLLNKTRQWGGQLGIDAA
jgi:hypothetical protein